MLGHGNLLWALGPYAQAAFLLGVASSTHFGVLAMPVMKRAICYQPLWLPPPMLPPHLAGDGDGAKVKPE